MKEKQRIKETKLLIESWEKHIVEASGGLAGLNREKIVQLLKRLGGNDGSQDLPGGDGQDDAMPADGADDDAIEVDNADIVDSEEELSLNNIMVVLNQLRNTGGLSFEDMGNEMLNTVRDAVKRTIGTLGNRGGVNSRDKEQDKKNIEEVGNRIIQKLETVFEKLFQPQTLMSLQEVLKVIKEEEGKQLNESKGFTIVIRS